MLNLNESSQFNSEVPNTDKDHIKIEKVSRETEGSRLYWEEKYKDHSMSQKMINDIIAYNQEGIYLYETKKNNEQDRQINHILWIYNRPENIRLKEISAEEKESLFEKSEIIEQVNISLIQIYDQVVNSYDWKYKPKGFVIDNSEDFGGEVGHIAGIRFSYQRIKPLVEAIEKKDEEEIRKQQKRIANYLTHELGRLERGEGLIPWEILDKLWGKKNE